MPQIQALIKYWQAWPPTHEVMRISWLKMEEKTSKPEVDGDQQQEQPTSDQTIAAFLAIESVSPHWRGGPPVRPIDVVRMAERKAAELKNG